MATFILTNLPIVIIKFKIDFGNQDEFNDFEKRFEELLMTNENLLILFDASRCNPPPIKYILQHGLFMIRNDNNYKNNINKTSILLPSETWKYYLDILFKFRKTTKPNLITISQRDAVEFLIN